MAEEAESAPVAPIWSLITVAYNSAQPLAHHWAGARPDNVEWIVVDNASTDESSAVARRLGADTVIELPQNIGFGGANNAGFRVARGRYVAFVNPDISVDYSALHDCEEFLDENGGICSPQLTGPDGSLQPNGRMTPSLRNKVFSRLGVKRVVDEYHVYAGPGESPDVDWVIGAAVLGSKSTFSVLGKDGPWDPEFFVYYEDSDLGLRAWKSGVPVRLVGGATWIHGWERATASLNWRAWKLELDSMTTFYRRYPALILGRGAGPWPSAGRKRRRPVTPKGTR
ncbi:MAG: glycosyltransferase [Microbacterium sp.]|nr:glycosyltransferase [Microbacterium sp.]